MPDRIASVACTIYADLPGFTTPTATVTNPAGTAVTTGAVTDREDGRWSVSIAAAQLTRHGVYAAVWTDGTNTSTQTFTVGLAEGGVTPWDLRLQVASRLGKVWEGVVQDALGNMLSDGELLGGPANYKGQWIVLHPSAGTELMGQVRRVADYSGSALTLSRPFTDDPPSNTRYAMLPVDPREIDRALRIAYREMTQRARVPASVGTFTLTDYDPVTETGRKEWYQFTVPDWVTHVDTLYNEDGLEIHSSLWGLLPGRKLILDGTDLNLMTVGDTVSISGVRRFRAPVFEDSEVEAEPTALVARAALELMSTRAGGPGVDVKDYLRRSIIMQTEYDAALKQTGTRLPGGSRPVII